MDGQVAIKSCSQAGGFYGSRKRKHLLLQKSIESHVAAKKSHPVHSAVITRIGEPVPFVQQQKAFRYSQSQSEPLHVFACESNASKKGEGTWTYLVASYPVFWQYYQHLQQSQRHHYELIPEGALCKLYFVLEFATECNQSRNGSEMTQTFIKFLSACLQQFFSVECPSHYIMDLSARFLEEKQPAYTRSWSLVSQLLSTPSKFHRHLVYNIPNIAFKDNSHAGNFIRYIFSNVMDRVNQHEETESVSKACSCSNMSNTEIKEQDVRRTMASGEENETKCVNEHCTCNHVNQDSGTKHLSEHNNNTEEGHQMDNPSSMDRKMVAILKQFTHEELQSLIVCDEKGDQVLFCNTGVYSKNQSFRLYLSHRQEEDNPLRLTSPCRDAASSTKEKRQQIDKQTFLDSLITNISRSNDLRILTFADVYITLSSKSSASQSFSSNNDKQLMGDFDDLDDQWLVQVAEEAEVNYGPDCLSDEDLLEAVNEAEQCATLRLIN